MRAFRGARDYSLTSVVFEKKVPARKFAQTQVSLEAEEIIPA